MKHCHISILCNELPFLKEKLPYLYEHFEQLIFVDYNIITKGNSTDGSIEFIENFKDENNKITLIKDLNEDKLNKINYYHGDSFIEKRKMFAIASYFVKQDMDIVWATDLDEFFETELINDVENLFNNDKHLQSIDLPHKIFVYNQYNYYNKNDFYIAPRITRHRPNFIYGHCNFDKYGKTIRYNKRYLYHFAFVGYNRCFFKFNKVYNNKKFNHINWLNNYLTNLKKKEKYINLEHSNTELKLISQPYNGTYPDYLNLDNLCNELNNIENIN